MVVQLWDVGLGWTFPGRKGPNQAEGDAEGTGESVHRGKDGADKGNWYPPPPCISYTNVRNHYSPYTYCSLDKGVAYTRGGGY